ncbi:MAG: iron-siderophore ABC transporter substrate-binding protein, partial [Kamptonema sp. SIO4C4]|nr:iron-siderophore ABC transporter substrate-binding protein [Kamptonema sp. SIO4C4]
MILSSYLKKKAPVLFFLGKLGLLFILISLGMSRPVEATEPPQRVVTLGNAALEAALVLHLKPVGAAPWVAAGHFDRFPGFLSDQQITGIDYLGDVNQPNLEKIVALHPDLILGNQVEHGAIEPLLAKIAPTVLCDVRAMPWQASFRIYAGALQQVDAAERVIQAYSQRLAELSIPERQVSVVRFMPSQVRLYLRGSPIGEILQEAGLSRPPVQNQARWKLTLSLETIPLADAEVIFVAQSDPKGLLYEKFT